MLFFTSTIFKCDFYFNVGMRSFTLNPRIVSDPQTCGGEPCIKGTRIPVHVILSHLAAGEDYNTILKQFPRLTKEDIMACLEYAAFLATEKAVSG